MAIYRKKPVEIEAVPVSELLEYFRSDWSKLPDWVENAYETGVIVAITNVGFTIKTLEGDHYAGRDDMVIKGVQGELYPCKPDIFKQTYDLVG